MTARLLAGVRGDGALDLDGHLAVHGSLPLPARKRAGGELIEEIRRSGLRGRGGGGFPLASKMSAVLAAGGRPVVVVNAAESEPATVKDAVLVTRAPHLVLDGAQLAAAALRAREIVVWTHRGDVATDAALGYAVIERRERGIDAIPVRVVAGPARYVAGESSALVNHLSGNEARPTFGIRASHKGVGGRPTLVANAETYAHAALIARRGAAWFRERGLPDEPGTMLVTVVGAVQAPGVLELPIGAGVSEALAGAGGLVGRPTAALFGGYEGTWLALQDAKSLSLSAASLAAAGGSLGTCLVAVLPEDTCGVIETARMVRWLAGETAGQCGPCVNGLPAMAGAMDRLVLTGDPSTRERLLRWAGMVERRGACHHPDGVAMLVRSALRTFAADLDAHAQRGPCGPRPAFVPLPDTSQEPWR